MMALPIPVPSERVLRAVPDHFSRHYRAFLEIEPQRDGDKQLRILDVGGRAGLTAEFFPKDDVVLVDVREDQDDVVVVEAGAPLPFEAGEFDFVVSFDVLEHVRPNEREFWLQELCRVASRAVVITVPMASPEASKAEHRVDQFYQQLAGRPHPWLVEHQEYGVPEREFVARVLTGTGLAWRHETSNPIKQWVPSMLLGFVRDYARDVLESYQSIEEFNQRFLSGDAAQPAYRSIYVVSVDGTTCVDAPSVLVGAVESPYAALEAGLLDLHKIERKLRFERDQAHIERDQARTEREQTHGECEALRAECEALRARYGEAQQEAERLKTELDAVTEQLHIVLSSRTWKAAEKLRRLVRR